jgi:hypothetical protein
VWVWSSSTVCSHPTWKQSARPHPQTDPRMCNTTGITKAVECTCVPRRARPPNCPPALRQFAWVEGDSRSFLDLQEREGREPFPAMCVRCELKVREVYFKPQVLEGP